MSYCTGLSLGSVACDRAKRTLARGMIVVHPAASQGAELLKTVLDRLIRKGRIDGLDVNEDTLDPTCFGIDNIWNLGRRWLL
jgi:hypothetical protein